MRGKSHGSDGLFRVDPLDEGGARDVHYPVGKGGNSPIKILRERVLVKRNNGKSSRFQA